MRGHPHERRLPRRGAESGREEKSPRDRRAPAAGSAARSRRWKACRAAGRGTSRHEIVGASVYRHEDILVLAAPAHGGGKHRRHPPGMTTSRQHQVEGKRCRPKARPAPTGPFLGLGDAIPQDAELSATDARLESSTSRMFLCHAARRTLDNRSPAGRRWMREGGGLRR